jgi:hypothetical protein
MALVTGYMGLDMIHHDMDLIPVVPSQHIQVHPMTAVQVTMVLCDFHMWPVTQLSYGN